MRPLIGYLIAFFIAGWPALIYAQPKPSTSSTSQPTSSGGFRIGDNVRIGDPGLTIGDVKVGDKAKNLKVLVPWTMRKCPKDFFATYGLLEAKQLKKIDANCDLWRTSTTNLKAQTESLKVEVTKLKEVNANHEAQDKKDQTRIKELTDQLNKEIEEKNKHKYKPNNTWLIITIGAVVAAIGAGFGLGAWVMKKD